MSGSAIYLAFIIPALAVIGFGIWIGAVHYAHRHPRQEGTAEPLKHEVKGGAFRSYGGRQLMPRRDAVPPEALKYEDGNHGHDS